MHRQIAGKLTGRVTKWIVLVAWIWLTNVAMLFGAVLLLVIGGGGIAAAFLIMPDWPDRMASKPFS